MSAGVAVDQVFAALADSTRRDLLEVLASEGESSASAMAKTYPVTRQAIARHLQVLAGAGLVVARKRGRELCFSVQPRALLATARWMERAADRWDERLSRIKQIAEELDA
jgi:DNA-binding transcriptional ArsR family regulator